MPIAYERDDARRLILVTVTNPYAVDEILQTIDRQVAEGAWEYAMLYELQAPMAIPADSTQIAAHVEKVGGRRPRGPVGIAIRAETEQFRRTLAYSDLTKSTTAVEVLLTPEQREAWLLRHAPRRRADE